MSSTLTIGTTPAGTANELYEMLSLALREKLAGFEKSWTAPQGTHLLQHSVMPEHLIILRSGKVEVILHSARKSVSSGFSEAGKVFGMRAIISDEPQELEVICATPCLVTSLPRDIFLGLLKSNPEMYTAVARVLGSDLQIANGLLRNTVHRRSRIKANQSGKICVM
jgi:CRP-like cAMP-binding protein